MACEFAADAVSIVCAVPRLCDPIAADRLANAFTHNPRLQLTRKYGIIHFGSIIVRMRQLLWPVLVKHGSIHVETEADNFLAMFPTSSGAVK